MRTEAPEGSDATVRRLLQTEEAAYFLHTGKKAGYCEK